MTDTATAAQLDSLRELFDYSGIAGELREWASDLLGRTVTEYDPLTAVDARLLIDELEVINLDRMAETP